MTTWLWRSLIRGGGETQNVSDFIFPWRMVNTESNDVRIRTYESEPAGGWMEGIKSEIHIFTSRSPLMWIWTIPLYPTPIRKYIKEPWNPGLETELKLFYLEYLEPSESNGTHGIPDVDNGGDSHHGNISSQNKSTMWIWRREDWLVCEFREWGW